MLQTQGALDNPGNDESAIGGDSADFLEDWHTEFLVLKIVRGDRPVAKTH